METLIFDDHSLSQPDVKGMSDRILLEAIYGFIVELKQNADLAIESIDLDTRTLKQLLRISERTACRWRSNKNLRYHVRQDGTIYYKFQEVYVDVKAGNIKGRNFSRGETLERMALYRNGVLKGETLQDWDNEYANSNEHYDGLR